MATATLPVPQRKAMIPPGAAVVCSFTPPPVAVEVHSSPAAVHLQCSSARCRSGSPPLHVHRTAVQVSSPRLCQQQTTMQLASVPLQQPQCHWHRRHATMDTHGRSGARSPSPPIPRLRVPCAAGAFGLSQLSGDACSPAIQSPRQIHRTISDLNGHTLMSSPRSAPAGTCGSPAFPVDLSSFYHTPQHQYRSVEDPSCRPLARTPSADYLGTTASLPVTSFYARTKSREVSPGTQQPAETQGAVRFCFQTVRNQETRSTRWQSAAAIQTTVVDSVSALKWQPPSVSGGPGGLRVGRSVRTTMNSSVPESADVQQGTPSKPHRAAVGYKSGEKEIREVCEQTQARVNELVNVVKALEAKVALREREDSADVLERTPSKERNVTQSPRARCSSPSPPDSSASLGAGWKKLRRDVRIMGACGALLKDVRCNQLERMYSSDWSKQGPPSRMSSAPGSRSGSKMLSSNPGSRSGSKMLSSNGLPTLLQEIYTGEAGEA
eukprot:TRINITY_DN3112_c0_g1_i1.p1 TRINITY_DN3112_c0_g1~~TRINITY_DN3112_c0_g1_i1.p1  ORF type:complete len:510 (-),score=38.03 TRINITY_DN3112_c0_g1_i1:103-1584(-)